MMRISKKELQELFDLACQLQQIPSPTFYEGQKAEYLAERFRQIGLLDVHLDAAGNALGRAPGAQGSLPPLVISAHIDTVHPASVDLALTRRAERITGPAIGDNNLGVAALLILARRLTEIKSQAAGDIWLIGNVGEEGLGDLRGMRQIVNDFGGRPVAYLVLEGMGLGQIYHRGLGVERYRISASAPGGHSWVDYGKPSAIVALAGVVTRLSGLQLPRQPRTTLNVGRIEGGTSVNTIAAHACLELDLRSEDPTTLQDLVAQVHRLVEITRAAGVHFSIERIGRRPAGLIPSTHPLVRLAESALREEGISPRLEIASTDANIPLATGIPAVCIGLTHGGNAHTLAETIEIESAQQGMGQVVRIIETIWDRLK